MIQDSDFEHRKAFGSTTKIEVQGFYKHPTRHQQIDVPIADAAVGFRQGQEDACRRISSPKWAGHNAQCFPPLAMVAFHRSSDR